MIAVDSNVLARYLLNDDLEQAKAFAHFFRAGALMQVITHSGLAPIHGSASSVTHCGRAPARHSAR